jgi:hypothetical protein
MQKLRFAGRKMNRQVTKTTKEDGSRKFARLLVPFRVATISAVRRNRSVSEASR